MDNQQCDICPATSQVRVTLQSGKRLYFCLHHNREFFPETGVYPGLLFDYAKQDLTVAP